jgi:hypothetical protein
MTQLRLGCALRNAVQNGSSQLPTLSRMYACAPPATISCTRSLLRSVLCARLCHSKEAVSYKLFNICNSFRSRVYQPRSIVTMTSSHSDEVVALYARHHPRG